MITAKDITSPYYVSVTHVYINERPTTYVLDLAKVKDEEYLSVIIKALNARHNHADCAYETMDGCAGAIVKAKGVTLQGAVTLDETDEANNAWLETHEEEE